MNPILASKAKEIITSYCRHIYLEGNEKYFDDWLESPEAAALLSGEDWKEGVITQKDFDLLWSWSQKLLFALAKLVSAQDSISNSFKKEAFKEAEEILADVRNAYEKLQQLIPEPPKP